MAKGQAPASVDPRQANFLNRSIVLGSAVEMTQSIYSQSVLGTPGGQVVNIPVRPVGLIKRFYIVVEFDLAQSAAETLTRTQWGPANVLSQVVFTDLSNQSRINTTGWHLHAVASAKRKGAFGASFTNDAASNFGSVLSPIVAPASVTTIQHVRQIYELPLAYSDTDTRGAVYANVVNAQASIQATINPNIVVASTANNVGAVYQSSTAAVGLITNMKVTVYQQYLDQIPFQNGQPILPMLDLSTAYTINNTVLTALAVNADNPIQYANFREFLSTVVVFDQQGALNAGTDVNYFALSSANYTNIFKKDPNIVSLETRNGMGNDFPKGSYYFDHRGRPINTTQYGNMQLLINPSSVVGAASQFLIGFEALALISMVTQAGSFPSN